jgi:hypothetical protein
MDDISEVNLTDDERISRLERKVDRLVSTLGYVLDALVDANTVESNSPAIFSNHLIANIRDDLYQANK